MEVTHLAHQNTHAVIGGLAPESFGVEDNAEFYEMLSSTMYPNKKLAVVREVLCNSWDAHLMVGKTDVPVKVTITDKEMVFKDFGPGIGREQIIKIYCTYGKSTKSHDGKQTGGFGLGSKSPFAYSKHFTVTSCHKGLRTLYAASRGSVETQGKPDFRPMVADIPTDETGITVTIPLMSANDRPSFETLVRDLAFLGGIKCELNGKLLPVASYEKAEWPFVLLSHREIGQHHGHNNGLYVRYGAVVYPVDLNDENIKPIIKEAKFLASLCSHYGVVLMAQPNTIGVAPSRETLSYTDKTVQTIVGLIQNAESLILGHKNTIKRRTLKILGSAIARQGSSLISQAQNLMRKKDDPYDYAKDVLYSNRQSPLPRAFSSREIILVVSALAVSNCSRTNIAKALDDMNPADLFAYMRKALHKRAPGWKRYLHQAETPTSMAKHHSGRFRGTTSLRYDLENSFSRMMKHGEALNVRFVFGHFSYDEFTEEEVGIFSTRVKEKIEERSFKGRPRRFASALNVIFAPSRAAAVRYRKNVKLSRYTPEIIALTRKSSDVESAMKLMEKFGFKTHDARDHVVKRQKIEPSEKLYLLPDCIKKLGGDVAFSDLVEYDPAVSKAQFYCYGSVSESRTGHKFLRAEILPKAWNFANKHLGDVVVIFNAADARTLGKAGLRNVYEALGEKIVAFSKTEDGADMLLHKTQVLPEVTDWARGYNILCKKDDKTQRFRDICESLGVSLKPVAELSEHDKDVFDLIQNIHSKFHLDSSGKFGSQFVIAGLRNARKAMQERYSRLVEIFGSKEFEEFTSALNNYYAKNMSEPILFALMSSVLQAIALQIALKPKTETN